MSRPLTARTRTAIRFVVYAATAAMVLYLALVAAYPWLTRAAASMDGMVRHRRLGADDRDRLRRHRSGLPGGMAGGRRTPVRGTSHSESPWRSPRSVRSSDSAPISGVAMRPTRRSSPRCCGPVASCGAPSTIAEPDPQRSYVPPMHRWRSTSPRSRPWLRFSSVSPVSPRRCWSPGWTGSACDSTRQSPRSSGPTTTPIRWWPPSHETLEKNSHLLLVTTPADAEHRGDLRHRGGRVVAVDFAGPDVLKSLPIWHKVTRLYLSGGRSEYQPATAARHQRVPACQP